MRLLISGASGFLGRRAAVHFRELGWLVLTPTHAELDITNKKDEIVALAVVLTIDCVTEASSGASVTISNNS